MVVSTEENKMYRVSEIFDTIQGEGAYSGERAVFLRFAGCNMWTGEEKDRSRGKSPCAMFCDTDFRVSKSTRMDMETIINNISQHRAGIVVITGGEPLLQLDVELLRVMKDTGKKIHLETNGTRPMKECAECFDWITVSPKLKDENTIIEFCNEVKCVYPTFKPEDYPKLLSRCIDSKDRPRRVSVQPQDGLEGSIEETVGYVLNNTEYALSFQVHKYIGVR